MMWGCSNENEYGNFQWCFWQQFDIFKSWPYINRDYIIPIKTVVTVYLAVWLETLCLTSRLRSEIVPLTSTISSKNNYENRTSVPEGHLSAHESYAVFNSFPLETWRRTLTSVHDWLLWLQSRLMIFWFIIIKSGVAMRCYGHHSPSPVQFIWLNFPKSVLRLLYSELSSILHTSVYWLLIQFPWILH